ncbi:hypothetical protein NC651_039547 [Populus alba x Populus x berolinensis]|nr:hypothetical protein NC651_039547 [Populus alba x Populus x berolinensis]
MINVSAPMSSSFAVETFDSEFLDVLSYAKRRVDTPECKEKLPNMVMKIGNQLYSLTRLFSLWTKSIRLNAEQCHFP